MKKMFLAIIAIILLLTPWKEPMGHTAHQVRGL